MSVPNLKGKRNVTDLADLGPDDEDAVFAHIERKAEAQRETICHRPLALDRQTPHAFMPGDFDRVKTETLGFIRLVSDTPDPITAACLETEYTHVSNE